MGYSEMWLGSRKTKGEKGDSRTEYRVEFAAAPENSPPPGYTLVGGKKSKGEKKIYSSEWLPTIEHAKSELVKAADFCRKEGIKIMVFFEIR
jgi:hypothetical protein